MTPIQVTGEATGVIEEKRLYLPGVQLHATCPQCGAACMNLQSVLHHVIVTLADWRAPAMMVQVSSKERVILELLIGTNEMYGLQMVKAEPGLKRGSIYVTLARMTAKGLVLSRAEPEEGASGIPKRKYWITKTGRRAFEAYELASAHFSEGFVG